MFDFLKNENTVFFQNRKEFLDSKINYYPRNLFIKVDHCEISKLEKTTFVPNPLKEFWLEIGEGFINCSNDGLIVSECNNQILSPLAIIDILGGNIDERPFFELETNTLPFFEIDPSSFICMKNCHFDTGIYWMHGGKIAESLQEFIRNLLINPAKIDWVEA